MELLYGLDTVEEGSIALNLLPLVSGGGCEGVRGLAARFHLLRVCEATVNQNLEGIDALLGQSHDYHMTLFGVLKELCLIISHVTTNRVVT